MKDGRPLAEATATAASAISRFDAWLKNGGPQPLLDGATVAALKELVREVSKHPDTGSIW